MSSPLINYRVVNNGEVAYSDESLPISEKMTVYAYNSTDVEVTIKDFNYSGVTLISNSDIHDNMIVPAGKIIALGLKSESSQDISYTELAAVTSKQQTYSSRLNLNAQTRAGGGAVLLAGNVPVYNTYGSSVNGTVTIQNVGQSSANNILITSSSDKLTIMGNTCGINLSNTASCTVAFTINDDSLNNTGNITIAYDGGIAGYSPLQIPVYWYNQSQTPLINASQSGILAQAGVPSIGSILLSNSGSYSISNLAATYISTSGLVTITPDAISCTGNQTAALLPNSTNSCTLNASFLANSGLTDTIKVVISGNYGAAQSYSRILLISFKSGAISSTSGTISAAMALTSSSTVTVTNNTLTTYSNISVIESSGNGVTVTSTSPTVTCSGAGNTLPPNGTCTYPVIAYAESIVDTSITTYINLQDSSGASFLFATSSEFIISSYYMYYSTASAGKVGYCSLDLNGNIQESSCGYTVVSGCTLATPTGVRAAGGKLILAQYASSNLCSCTTGANNGRLNCVSNIVPTSYLFAPRSITTNKNFLYVSNDGSLLQSGLSGTSPVLLTVPNGRNNTTAFFNNQLAFITTEAGNLSRCIVDQLTGGITSCTNIVNADVGLPIGLRFYGLSISTTNSMLYLGISNTISSSLNSIYGCSLTSLGVVVSCSPVTITGSKSSAGGVQFNFVSTINIVGNIIYILEHSSISPKIYQCTLVNNLTFNCDITITKNMAMVELMHVPGR